jgi:predicted nucleic acid-binding protein
METEAIMAILAHCDSGEWTLVSSVFIDLELQNSSDAGRLKEVWQLYDKASEFLLTMPETYTRAKVFKQHGMKDFDSLHLALAEQHKVNIFLTTDDKLLKAAQKINLDIRVANPLSWLMEVMGNEQ